MMKFHVLKIWSSNHTCQRQGVRSVIVTPLICCLLCKIISSCYLRPRYPDCLLAALTQEAQQAVL